MALYHFSVKMLARSNRNTVGALAYRAGCSLVDSRTGLTFDYKDKSVPHVELALPKDAPGWAIDIQKMISRDRQTGVQVFSDLIESAEKRINSQVYREFEFALHRELTEEQNIVLSREFVQDQLCGRGMTALLNFHFDVDEKTGEAKPHCHVVVATRRLEENGLSAKKEREWNEKAFLCELRVSWQDYSNFHLKLHGHDSQIDHRSNRDRGIEIEPQPKRGKNILEQERRGSFNQLLPVTDKAKEYNDVKLRNLYRIISRPDLVLDIVTKHHATFTWVDVQKVLHRYIDEAALFERLEAKLLRSSELLLLSPDSDAETKAIYTTRTVLKAEKSLISMAEDLSNNKSHGVDEKSIIMGIKQANETFKERGGLSQDQIRSIYHLVDVGQVKCVVGIAGAGKTTALGVCHEIWKEEGYAVYGLTPTGKAAQNLEECGIKSTTLHKFLKSFEEGRCQYNSKSILVLDEAGMVDVERFEELLSAVKKLGVKLIVVGDGAQLQPVEAGPAFRLVTERLGRAELNTVIRQKQNWQRQATVFFGRQETSKAIQKYVDQGFIHIVEEQLPSLSRLQEINDHVGIIKLYETTSRVSSLIYREMAKDVEQKQYSLISEHKDYGRYLDFRNLEKDSAKHILENSESCRSILEARGIDPFKMALLFVDKKYSKEVQYEEATKLLTDPGLASLLGIEKSRGQGADVRDEAKKALITSWHKSFQENSEKNPLMLAFSNKDVSDLNRAARVLLKETSYIEREEFAYTIKKEVEDDFGRKHLLHERKSFSKGDKIVFMRNNFGLGVKNGTLGIIKNLDRQNIQVKLSDGKEVSFSPNLNPYFDHGWAITIHKSQGTTVDQTFVLASYEMNQNMAYVSMTRHRENVQLFGSSLDFWRPEKLPEVLSKSGEKLSAADYLDGDSLTKLMQNEDRVIMKILSRIGNELEAMGVVTKRAFKQVVDHFLGINKEREILINPEHFSSVNEREEVRAETVLRKKNLNSLYEIKRSCENLIYDNLKRENRDVTHELKDRINLQADRATELIFHVHTLNETTPTDEDRKKFIRRAKYEFDRIPEIRQDIIKGWQREDNFDERKDGLLAHMIAERRASIEGRIYFEAKQIGEEIPQDIAERAEKEIDKHRTQTKATTQRISSEHNLSEIEATHCAKHILRYKETHGEQPTDKKVDAMVHIARNITAKYASKKIGAYEHQYLLRKECDLMFKEHMLRTHTSEAHQRFPVETQARTSLEVIKRQMHQDIEKINQKEFSL